MDQTNASPSTGDQPAEPRLSATMLLLRDAPELQVLMVKRNYEIDFASGALVFPGGKCAPGDAAGGWADRVDGQHDDKERVARIGAIREAFEETGILLARHATARGSGAPLIGADVAAGLAPMRGPVDRGEADFLSLIEEHDLVLATDQLVHFGHWITPTFMPKRFDTHFYLAATPPEQVAEEDGRETTDAVWITPGEALNAAASGSATIIFPTRLNLNRLSLASDTGNALSRFAAMPVPTVIPERIKDADGNPCLRIPEIEGYGQTIEPLSRIKPVMKGSARPMD